MYRALAIILALVISGCDSGSDKESNFAFAENEVVAMPKGYTMGDTYNFLHAIDLQHLTLQLHQHFADYEGQGVRFYFTPLVLHPSNGDADQLMVKIDITAPEGWP